MEEKEALQAIAEAVIKKAWYCTKEVLTLEEVAEYMGVSNSYIYKLTMLKKIPHYKPNGKICYFNRLEVEQWLQANRISTSEELNKRATDYLQKGGVK